MRASAAAVLVALALTAPGRAAEPGRASELLASGNAHYERGDFERAAEDYQRILDYGVENEIVHYNLGNAHFKGGRLGEAILSYERALRLDPRDREASDNLAYAVSLTVDRVQMPEPSFPRRALSWLIDTTSPREDAWLVLVAAFLLGATGTAWILAPSRAPRRAPLYLGAVLLAMAMWSGGNLALAEWRGASSRQAVILAEKVDVLSGPSGGNISLFTVHEGLRVQIRNVREGWAQILLPNGLNGWVPAASLGIV